MDMHVLPTGTSYGKADASDFEAACESEVCGYASQPSNSITLHRWQEECRQHAVSQLVHSSPVPDALNEVRVRTATGMPPRSLMQPPIRA